MVGKKIQLKEQDMKRALSNMKKAKQPKTVLIRNIIEYWPCLQGNQVTQFQEILENFSKKETYKQHLLLGLESTIRNLKSNPSKINLLAIADEISPRWFGRHLIAMALSKNPQLKIVIVPKLKDHTKNLFAIPSIIWCLKEGIALESLDDFYNELNIHDELLQHYNKIKPNKDVSIRRKKKVIAEKTPEIIHLKKSSTPAFVPKSQSFNDKISEPMELNSLTDFISLGKSKTESKGIAFPAYRPLKINKIIGNPYRKGK